MARNVYSDGYQYYHGKCCVFISHQQKDKPAAKLIANYLLSCGIDVYFDEYDKSINRGNPQSVVNAIKAGLRKSTHLMCLLSENAMKSKWTPWEVGYGYEHNVFCVKLKEVAFSLLPEYLQVVPVYSGYEALDVAIRNMRNTNNICEGQMRTFSNYSHPLSSIMFDNIDKYYG